MLDLLVEIVLNDIENQIVHQIIQIRLVFQKQPYYI